MYEITETDPNSDPSKYNVLGRIQNIENSLAEFKRWRESNVDPTLSDNSFNITKIYDDLRNNIVPNMQKVARQVSNNANNITSIYNNIKEQIIPAIEDNVRKVKEAVENAKFAAEKVIKAFQAFQSGAKGFSEQIQKMNPNLSTAIDNINRMKTDATRIKKGLSKFPPDFPNAILDSMQGILHAVAFAGAMESLLTGIKDGLFKKLSDAWTVLGTISLPPDYGTLPTGIGGMPTV